MEKCEVCGNDYDKSFTVTINEEGHVFDCFECAIHALAPRCIHCACAIIGHGVEVDDKIFCCAHCARNAAGITKKVDVRDRSEADTIS